MSIHNLRAFRLVFSFALFTAVSVLGFSQNLKDDIVNNDLDSLKSKVALLSPNFKEAPYVALYLRQSQQYQQGMLDYLIAQGADVDQADEQGLGPLAYAITAGNLEAVTTLIAKKADVNAAWKTDANPAGQFWFFDQTDLRVVNSLGWNDPKTKRYTTVSFRDERTLRPLAVALVGPNPEVTQALLAAGADPQGLLFHVKNPAPSTARPSAWFDTTIMDWLVAEWGSSQGRLDNVSPQFFANGVLEWKAVSQLAKAKQPTYAKTVTNNLFAYFATGAMKEFKAELVKTGADTLQFLPYAALAENWDIVDLILQYNQIGVDDSWNRGGGSLLTWALTNGHAGAARLLLEHGAVMPASLAVRVGYDTQNLTPLAWAAGSGNVEMVKVLLAAKADVNQGTPLKYAHPYPAIRTLLVQAGADVKAVVSYRDEFQSNLLYDAARDNVPEAVAFYLARGLSTEGLNGEPGTQALAGAVLAGNPEIVRILLAKGARPDALMGHSNWNSADYHDLTVLSSRLADAADTPQSKNRYTSIGKLLAKAIAAVPKRSLAPAMVTVPAGQFTMGNNKGDWNERPAHLVNVSSFQIATTEVTQELYWTVMGNNPGRTFGTTIPVSRVSYNDALAFCNALSLREGLAPVYDLETKQADPSSMGYRLPTEAEWEYAAAGTADQGLDAVAWVASNSGRKLHAVATKKPNALGVYDLLGNASEWCMGSFQRYTTSEETNPGWTNPGQGPVRGGSYDSTNITTTSRSDDWQPGIRLARSLGPVASSAPSPGEAASQGK